MSSTDWNDELYADALKLVTEYQKASATFLQRRLKIGYMRADLLISQLERDRVVGPFNGTDPRKVLIHPADQL